MPAGVPDAVESGRPLVAGRIVDRIDIHRLSGQPGAQRVDERLAGRPDARVFTGAARKHHLGVWTLRVSRRCGMGGCCGNPEPPQGGERSTDWTSEAMRIHEAKGSHTYVSPN
jgi:hypothetical protein